MFEFVASTALLCALMFWMLQFLRAGCSANLASHWVSTAHAAAQTYLAFLCCREALGYVEGLPEYTPQEMVWGKTPWSGFAGEVFLGYIVYDLVHVLAIPELRTWEAIVHHVLFAVVAYLGIVNSFLQFGFLWLIIGEVSTIFLNFRWMLFKAGRASSSLYFYNGIALLVSFFLTRVLFYGAGLAYMFLYLLPIVNESESIVLRSVPYVLVIAYCLNLYWFWTLASKAIGIISKKSNKAKVSK